MKRVFLSGPMKSVPREDSLSWRVEAEKKLSDIFSVSHAFRGREMVETMPTSRAAVIRDIADIKRADILLVNDSFENVSMIGTSMEMYIAFEFKIPVIVFGNVHKGDYWMDYHSHARVETLDDACFLLRNLFAS